MNFSPQCPWEKVQEIASLVSVQKKSQVCCGSFMNFHYFYSVSTFLLYYALVLSTLNGLLDFKEANTKWRSTYQKASVRQGV